MRLVLLAAFLCALPGAREVAAQTLGRVGASAEAGVSGSVGSNLSLAPLSVPPASTLVPTSPAASVTLAPSIVPTLARSAVPTALKASQPAASKPIVNKPVVSGDVIGAPKDKDGVTIKAASSVLFDGSAPGGGDAGGGSSFSGGDGRGPTNPAASKLWTELLFATGPGKRVPYVLLGKTAARLGLSEDEAAREFASLFGAGHLAVRDDPESDAVLHTFALKLAQETSKTRAAVHSLALRAVVRHNSGDMAERARAVADADKAASSYKALGEDEARAEAEALRGNAALSLANSMLEAHLGALKARGDDKYARREADVQQVLAWSRTALFETGSSPAMPRAVHEKLAKLLGSLNPATPDGRDDGVTDGYIAALDLLEKHSDFLYEGPKSKGSPAGGWKPDSGVVKRFLEGMRARSGEGETWTPAAMTAAGRALGLDDARIDAVIDALARDGRVLIMSHGGVVGFGFHEMASEDAGGEWDVHSDAVDALKLANSPHAASRLRAVAAFDSVLARYYSAADALKETKALEQGSIALADAKLEALRGALAAAPDAGSDEVRAALALLDGAWYAAERMQRFSKEQGAVLAKAATPERLAAAFSKGDKEAEKGAALVREFALSLESGVAPKMPAIKGKAAPGPFDSAEAFEETVKDLGMPADVRKTALAEFSKYASMDERDSEAQKVRTYLEWLLGLPWSARTRDQVDLTAARAELDKDHSGLEAVKSRVLEWLAVRKRTGSKKGAILVFTGPPGVGKTSIAGAIAQALGRKFVRLSLGGVHDESVIRGHGRTYVGSMPGEVMRQMKNAGTVNPVMLLDEADKMGREGNAGDPSAALLEVLDPEQNSTYRDRYLDVPYDLSEVLFVVTSNDLSAIPAPLRDRMEIVEFEGYTTLEKLDIAEKHVVPQKRAVAGLKDGEAVLTRGAIKAVIEGYTMEAGVRKLRQQVEALFRKVSAWTETKDEPAPAVIDESMVEKYLGVPRYSARPTAQNGVGVATGLAVNDFGGSTLNVEVSVQKGAGLLVLRKQFGDDIDDSAHNALKYVKTHAKELGLEGFDFAGHDVDIDITPAGKVDGPSAGSLMVTAIVSAMLKKPVRRGVAMTGEITMRGDVLPIGGLKQKVMAAHRLGYEEVVFPWDNRKDVESIPEEVRKDMKLTPVKTYSEILPVVLP